MQSDEMDKKELEIEKEKIRLEHLQLEIEREKINLEKKKAGGLNVFLQNNFGMLITALISFIAVLVSASQVWVAHINREREIEVTSLLKAKEHELKEQEYNRQWRFKLAKFVSDNMELIFSDDLEKRTSMRDVILVSFPVNYTQLLFKKLKSTASDKNKRFWEKGEELATDISLEEARSMTEEEAQDVEKKLIDTPNDLSLHSQLLAYFWLKESDEAKEKFRNHLFWIIKNHPASDIAGRGESALYRIDSKENYEKGKELWLQVASSNKNNPKLLGNAAHFIMYESPDQAEELLVKAKALEPENIKWTDLLAGCYHRKMLLTDGEKRKKAARNALRQYEILLLSTSGNQKFYILTSLTEISLEADELEKAKVYADELLSIVDSFQDDWNYGNAIHEGNIVLGRLSVITGDLDSAKKHLIEAGKTPGSPQLNSYGPNTTLAKELLELGEPNIVIEYFKLCSVFWKNKGELIEKWEEEIRSGKVPNFKKK